MKRFNYYKHEQKKNIEKLRKTSGAKTFRICLDLINTGVKFLQASIRSENPSLGKTARHDKLKEILWSR